jgi:hypothetical protein
LSNLRSDGVKSLGGGVVAILFADRRKKGDYNKKEV